MSDPIEVRPFADADRTTVITLADRLTIGVAAWRDDAAVAAAVRGWINTSTASNPDRAAFVAVVERQVVGFVSIARTAHSPASKMPMSANSSSMRRSRVAV
jgi:hypothetical protein